MARKYRRDARGRFAGGGFSGQSGGRGARLKASGTRQGGGAKMTAAKRSSPSGAIRRTDVVKARVHNAISKNVQANQSRGNYDQNRYRAEGRLSRLSAAEKRIAGQKRKPVAAGGAAAKPKAKSRKISDAKATRIVARIDARRPGMRRASTSTRRDQNLLRTQQRATDFLLAPSRRALKRGSQISTNESVRRAVANASPRRR